MSEQNRKQRIEETVKFIREFSIGRSKARLNKEIEEFKQAIADSRSPHALLSELSWKVESIAIAGRMWELYDFLESELADVEGEAFIDLMVAKSEEATERALSSAFGESSTGRVSDAMMRASDEARIKFAREMREMVKALESARNGS